MSKSIFKCSWEKKKKKPQTSRCKLSKIGHSGCSGELSGNQCLGWLTVLDPLWHQKPVGCTGSWESAGWVLNPEEREREDFGFKPLPAFWGNFLEEEMPEVLW